MIFSLLKIRKKTSAVLAGVAIGAGSLWALTLWYDIPRQELFSILGATVLLLLLIIVLALLLITVIKLASRGIAKLSGTEAIDPAKDEDQIEDLSQEEQH